MSKVTKQYRKDSVYQWIDSCLKAKSLSVSHALRKNTENGYIIEDLVDKLTAKQLKTLLGMLAACYGKGCQDTQDFYVPRLNELKQRKAG